MFAQTLTRHTIHNTNQKESSLVKLTSLAVDQSDGPRGPRDGSVANNHVSECLHGPQTHVCRCCVMLKYPKCTTLMWHMPQKP